MSSDSDFSDDRNYKRKIRDKKKKYQKIKKQDPIKLCAKLTAKLLTAAYKSKILKFKLDEDPLHRRNYFLIFMESPEMIFPQYKETCEVLIDYSTIGGEDIKYHVSKSIKNILHANIYVHSRSLIAELPGDGVKKTFQKFYIIVQT